MKSALSAILLGVLASNCQAGADDAAAGKERPTPPLKTRNVLLVTTDGLRWQEVFQGADRSLMAEKEGKVTDVPALTERYWRDDPSARRAALMPFVWGEIARRGQLFGNYEKGAEAKVTNGMNFSYPGYSEIFTGKGDPRIDSNDKVPNPNVTVLEWLNGKPEFAGRVGAFGSWDCFPWILNRDRSKLFVNAGYEPLEVPDMNANVKLMNRLLRETAAIWGGERFDSFTYQMGLEYLRQKKPRVLYLGFGDTDEFAHAGKYDLYLHSAHRVDAYLKELWDTVQAMPEYRGTTTLIVSTDHGRGEAADGQWRNHGEKTEGSERIWIAALGPDTPPLGERGDHPTVTQSQIAATLASILGQDFHAFRPEAGKPIMDVIGAK
jgi:hypothetical protein